MSGKKRKPLLLRLLLAVFLTLLVLAAAGTFLLSRYAGPWIRQELRVWAKENGYEHVEVAGSRIRLFPVSASIRGLRMDAGGKRAIEVEEAGVEVRLMRFLRGDLRIDRITLRGAKVRVDVKEDGSLFIAGLSLAGMEKRGGGRRGGTGQYGIDLLKIRDSSLHITAPDFETTVHVSDLEFREGKEIVAGTLGFQDIRLKIVHNTDDTWQLLSREGDELASLGSGEKRERSSLGKALSVLSLNLDRIEIVGDSTVTFTQLAPGEEYETTYRLDRAYLTDIRSDRPDSVSKFLYEATSNHHEHFLLEGSGLLFARPSELTVTGVIEGIELVPFSPFLSRAAGFAIDSGQADGDIDIKVSGGEIEGLVDIRVNLLTVSTTDKKKLRAFEQTLPKQIKLSTAIRLLSDKRGVIPLKIPISGDASAPTFDFDLDISAAINNALGGIVQTGLLVAAPWAVATINALFVKRPPFEEIPFAPLSDELNEMGRKTVAEFSKRISGRKDLLSLVCGFATEEEMRSLPEEEGAARNRAVLEIAERRARRVKDVLVTEHGIEARRLILCRPELNYRDRSTVLTDTFGDEDTRKPRVELR
jgi:hypothetical protein